MCSMQDTARSSKARNADEQIKTYFDGSYYALYLEYKAATEAEEKTPLSWRCFMDAKPFWVKTSRKVVSCICSHHRMMVLRAKALANARCSVHREMGNKRPKGCCYNDTCKCKCAVCSKDTTGADLGDFKDMVMCPRGEGERHYKVPCVLQSCDVCGVEKMLGGCPVEVKSGDAIVTTTVLGTVIVDTPKGPSKRLAPVTSDGTFNKFVDATKEEAIDFVKHDFVARWQGDLYHDMLTKPENLPYGTELWVSDYIEVIMIV